LKINLGIAQLSMQRGRIKACRVESLLSPGALTVDRQSAPIARWNAAGSLSAFSATTIIRRTDVQGSQSRAIRGRKTERKQRSFFVAIGLCRKKAGRLMHPSATQSVVPKSPKI
jgi:hypothetical protein